MKKYKVGLEQHTTFSFRCNVLCLLLAYGEFYMVDWDLTARCPNPLK